MQQKPGFIPGRGHPGPGIGPPDANANSTPLAEKVATYEHFLNETLRSDLKRILDQREELYSQVAEYLEQETILKKLGAHAVTDGLPAPASPAPLRLKVDLGCNFYAQAEVANTEKILFDFGLGTWVPVTLQHGAQLCQQQITRLNKRVALLTQEELRVKAQINLVVEALNEIQGIGLGRGTPN